VFLGRPGDWVFHHYGQPNQSFEEAWKSAVTAAGLKGKVFHDLRRTAVRNYGRAGAPYKVAMPVTGHGLHNC
jgi:integrase